VEREIAEDRVAKSRTQERAEENQRRESERRDHRHRGLGPGSRQSAREPKNERDQKRREGVQDVALEDPVVEGRGVGPSLDEKPEDPRGRRGNECPVFRPPQPTAQRHDEQKQERASRCDPDSEHSLASMACRPE
jgi:hypothetical protein